MLGKEALKTFGRRWATDGWASLLFDFRGFGGSGGLRSLYSPSMQLEDYRSVIRWAHTRNLLISDQIVVMGSCSSGLAVAELALNALNERIIGAIAQCPLLDGKR